MEGVIAVATLIGAIGVKIAGEITETMAGAATAGVTIAGTMAGMGIAGDSITTVRGAIATFAGGMIVPTIAGDGTAETITGGTTVPGIDAGAGTGIGRTTSVGGETSVCPLPLGEVG